MHITIYIFQSICSCVCECVWCLMHDCMLTCTFTMCEYNPYYDCLSNQNICNLYMHCMHVYCQWYTILNIEQFTISIHPCNYTCGALYNVHFDVSKKKKMFSMFGPPIGILLWKYNKVGTINIYYWDLKLKLLFSKTWLYWYLDKITNYFISKHHH